MGCLSCCSVRRVFIGVNFLLFLVGAVALGIGSYEIYSYDDATSFLSKSAYGMMVAAGVISVIITIVAICEARKDDDDAPNKLFCYWCVICFVLILNMSAFYYFQVIFGSIGVSSGNIAEVVQTEIAKELQDSILSSYTVCCTGCDTSIAELQCDTDQPSVTPACNTSALELSTSGSNVVCEYAKPCFGNETNQGIGQGCYASATVIPSYPIGSDSCTLLETIDHDGKPLVGSPETGSCGGGDPQQYLDNAFAYIDSIYTRTLVAWGFFIALLAIALLGAGCLIVFPQFRDY